MNITTSSLTCGDFCGSSVASTFLAGFILTPRNTSPFELIDAISDSPPSLGSMSSRKPRTTNEPNNELQWPERGPTRDYGAPYPDQGYVSISLNGISITGSDLL